jgi:hypothetical protein
MTKKSKKSSKTKKPKVQPPFEIGLESEQALADSLCDKFLQDDVGEDDIDDAFCGAFSGLAHRMLTIFNKEFVLGIVEDMSKIAEEDRGKPHVCNDCQEKHGSAPKISDKDRNKMN